MKWPDQPWCYSTGGYELRLDCMIGPYRKIWMQPISKHSSRFVTSSIGANKSGERYAVIYPNCHWPFLVRTIYGMEKTHGADRGCMQEGIICHLQNIKISKRFLGGARPAVHVTRVFPIFVTPPGKCFYWKISWICFLGFHLLCFSQICT